MNKKHITRLSAASLAAAVGIEHPNYKLKDVTPGIVHIGPGGFSMSHLGSYVHSVLEKDPSWGIIAVSLRSRGTIDALKSQDNLYVLVERERGEQKSSVIGAICDSMWAPEDPKAVVAAIANPQIRLVTMTISAAGYHLAEGGISLVAHDVVHDLHLPDGDTPKTVYWYLAQALVERAKTGSPLTIMSLDNVQRNSRSLKKALLQYIVAAGHADLVDWIKENVSFPISTVDRITPEPTEEFRQQMNSHHGFESAVTIGTEGFKQLVVEESRHPMPAWNDAGVLTVPDCRPYWELKFFGLNTAHQVIAMPSLRMGLKYVHDGAEHPQVSRLLKKAHEEFASFMPVEPVLALQYMQSIQARFTDYSLGDTNARVGARGTEKASHRLLASVERGLEATGEVLKAPTFVVACWLLNLGGVCEIPDAPQIELGDSHAPKLQEHHQEVLAWAESEDPQHETLATILARIGEVTLDERFVRLAGNAEVVSQLGWSVREIHQKGIEQAIESLLAA